MNVEEIFKNTKLFQNIRMDIILVESKYPVLFTCKDKNDTYLFVCCTVNSKIVQWIGTKIKCETLVMLLKNEITIRDAFLKDYVEKFLIEYDGVEKAISERIIVEYMLLKDLLPTEGEYMDAEEDEFEEEIEIFSSRIKNIEFSIKPQVNWFLLITPCKRIVTLADDYYSSVADLNLNVSLDVRASCQINVAYA